MLDPGSNTSLPASYRITLAASLALLVHTLILSALPLLFDQTERVASSLTFELVAPGSQPTRETVASADSPPPSPTSRSPESRNPDFDIAASDPASVETPTGAERNKAQPRSAVAEPPAPEQPRPVPENSPASKATESAAEGAPAEVRPDAQTSDIMRFTAEPEETGDYLVQLATDMARQLKRSRIRGVHALTQSVAMEVELQLLESGALTRARVVRSSGVEEIDAAAYRAALAASPYPEIPESDDRRRFRVELVFSPERLARP